MTTPWQPPAPVPVQPPQVIAAPVQAPPPPPGYAVPPVYSPFYAPPPVVRKTHIADIAVTCGLLGIGLLAVLISLTLPPQLSSVVAQGAIRDGVSSPDTSKVPAVAVAMVISQVVLYLAALGVSILLMVKRRIAFWMPLSAGALAAILFWGLFIGALLSDPRVLTAIQSHH